MTNDKNIPGVKFIGYSKRTGKKRFRITIEAGISPRTGNRGRIVKYFEGRKKDAELFRADLRAQIKRGEYTEPSKLTVSEWLTAWLEDYKKPKLRATTYETYEIMIRVHVIPAIGTMKLQSLRSEHLQKLYNEKLKTHSTKTVNYMHMIVQQALERARKVRPPLLMYNPAEGTSLPTIKRKEIKPLTQEQVTLFLNAAQTDRLYAAYLLIVSTGLRRGELLGLRWKSVDLKKARLTITQSWTKTNEGPHFDEPKTKAGRRGVPIPAEAVAELESHKKRQAQEILLAGENYQKNDLVFCQLDGKPINPDFFTKHFQVLLKRAGIPRVRLHDLRHTFATLLLEAGEYPKVVQEMLGHSQIAMTMDTYSHVVPGMKERAAVTMNGILQGLRHQNGTKLAIGTKKKKK